MRRMNRDDEGIALVLVTIGMTALLLHVPASPSTSVRPLPQHGHVQNSADAACSRRRHQLCPWQVRRYGPCPTLKTEQTRMTVRHRRTSTATGTARSSDGSRSDCSVRARIPTPATATAKWGGS